MAYSIINPLYPKRAMDSANTPVASQATAVTTTAAAPTGYTSSSSSNGVQIVAFDVQGGNVRARWDGTDPTSTVGHILYVGTGYQWSVDQYNAAKFICDGAGTNATVFASPFQG